jgi:hypothetical protein
MRNDSREEPTNELLMNQILKLNFLTKLECSSFDDASLSLA